MRGRRPDGDKVQEAKGFPGKHRRRAALAQLVQGAELDDGTPAHLSDAARKLWSRIMPELNRIRFVRRSDRPILERYCETLAEYWDLQLQLRGKPRVYWTESLHGKLKRIDPTVLLLHRVEKLLQDQEDRVGLNPLARQRILLGLAATQGTLPLEHDDKASVAAGDASDGDGAEAGEQRRSPVGLLN